MINWNKWDPACVDDSEELPDQSYVMSPNYNYEKLLSKVKLALFIMKDNEWHNDEGSIEYQVYKILEKAVEEL